MLSFRDSLPNLRSNIRFLHAAAGAPAVDIYANGNLLDSNVSFSNSTKYSEVPPGKCKIEFFKAGTYDTPISKEIIDLKPNITMTISAILDESNLVTFKLIDGLDKTNAPLTNLRFITLSPSAPLLTLALPSGTTLFNGVEYLETTNYYSLSAGIYDFLLTATNDSSFRKFLKDIDLQSDYFHTIYIIGLVDQKPQLGYLYLKDGL